MMRCTNDPFLGRRYTWFCDTCGTKAGPANRDAIQAAQNTHECPEPPKPAKSDAQRSAEYRARKRGAA